MKIAVLKEAAGETRCAAIPETVKKFTALGAEMAVERGAGELASVPDADFEAAGATIGTRKDILKGSGIILAVDGPDPKSLAERLDGIAGVVEHGLFIGLAHAAIVAGPSGVRVIERR